MTGLSKLLPSMLEGNPDAPLIVERVYYTLGTRDAFTTRFGDAPVVHKPVVHKDAPLQGKRMPSVCRDPDKRRAYKTAWQAKARASTKSGEAAARKKEPVAAHSQKSNRANRS